VKRLNFANLVAVVVMICAAPAAAQLAGNQGSDFVEAVRGRDGDKASQLLQSNPPSLINTRGADGDTPLLIAIERRDEDWTGFLLNKGADPNLPGKGGELPLVAASRMGFETAAEWLLSGGAKVDGANRAGETALIVAVQSHQPSLVRLLLSLGADPDKTDHVQGYSAREYATRDPRARDILKLITDQKPKP
jgi:ankyrin repeat protein